MINIVNKKIQRIHALLESTLDPLPFRRFYNAGDNIERKNPFSAGILAVHIERNPHVQQRTLGGLLTLQQFSIKKRQSGIYN